MLRAATFVLLCLLLCALLSCSGSVGQRPAPGPSRAEPGLAAVGTIPEDAYVDPLAIQARRGNAVIDLERTGDEPNAAGSGFAPQTATMTADFAAGGAASWAIYRFEDLLSADNPNLVQIELDATQPLPARLWVGFSDYNSGRWQWVEVQSLTASNSASLGGAWDPISPAGNFYVALVITGNDTMRLAKVSLSLDHPAPPPTAVGATDGTSDTRITLAWTPPGGVAPQGYTVERADSRLGPWTQLGGTLGPAITSYNDVHADPANVLPVGQQFFYRVHTIAAGVKGPASLLDTGWRGARPTIGSLTATPDAGEIPLVAQLTASGAVDPDGGTIVSYEWDWTSDGTYDLITGTAPTAISIGYVRDGLATVRVTDDEGQTQTASVPLDTSSAARTYGVAGLSVSGFKGFPNADGSYVIFGGSTATFPGPNTEDIGMMLGCTAEGELASIKRLDRGTAGAQFTDVVGDGAGNYYVCGSYFDGVIYHHGLVIRLDSAGNAQWAVTWGGSKGDTCTSIALVGTALYVAGYSDSFSAGSSEHDGFLLKYDTAGVLQWQKSWRDVENTFLADLVSDGTQLYAVGNTGVVGSDGLVMCLGLDGSQVWAKQWGTATTSDNFFEAAIDQSGNLLVGGNVYDAAVTNSNAGFVRYGTDGTLVEDNVWGLVGSNWEDVTGLLLGSDGVMRACLHQYDLVTTVDTPGMVELDDDLNVMGGFSWTGPDSQHILSAFERPGGDFIFVGSAPRIINPDDTVYATWPGPPAGSNVVNSATSTDHVLLDWPATGTTGTATIQTTTLTGVVDTGVAGKNSALGLRYP
jgi:hypothetical protein